jgi:hypothetical protein
MASPEPNGWLRAYLEDRFGRLESKVDDLNDRLGRLEVARAVDQGQREWWRSAFQTLRDWLGWVVALAMLIVQAVEGRWTR